MAIDYARLKSWPFGVVEQVWTERDTMLYALAVGCGGDPGSANDLHCVYEADLQALPTMATVLCYPGFWMQHEDTGIDWQRVVNGEQRLQIHRPLPAKGTLVGRSRVTHITDKGAAGVLVTTERQVSDAASGVVLATVQTVAFCRGDGGYSATDQASDEPLPILPPVPQRCPEQVGSLTTRTESALLYRLASGDMNPLHADPAVATAAGFDRPILHGQASFAIAGRTLIAACCDGQPSRLTSIAARFTAPVYPGETLRTEIWQDGESIHFRTLVSERQQVVLDHGIAIIRHP